jgi:hypothetical protein
VAILGSTFNAVSTVHLMLPSSLNAGKITDMSRTVLNSPLDWIEVGNYVCWIAGLRKHFAGH